MLLTLSIVVGGGGGWSHCVADLGSTVAVSTIFYVKVKELRCWILTGIITL